MIQEITLGGISNKTEASQQADTLSTFFTSVSNGPIVLSDEVL